MKRSIISRTKGELSVIISITKNHVELNKVVDLTKSEIEWLLENNYIVKKVKN